VSVFLGWVVTLAALGWCVDLEVEGVTQAQGAGTHAALAAPLDIPVEAFEYDGIMDITDAEAGDDVWFILDRRAFRVHVLGPGDHDVTTFGRGGSGEGQLTRPSALVLHGDTVVVVEQLGGVVHLFDESGRHIADRRFQVPGCRTPVVSDAVSTAEGLTFLVTCPGVRLNTKAFAALENAGADASILASTAARRTPRDRIDPFFTPVLASHRDGILFGATGDACLSVVDLSGVSIGKECTAWLERLPVPAMEQTRLTRVQNRLATLAARMESPETLPPFDALFPLGVSSYAFRVPTRHGGGSRQLAVEPGNTVAVAHLPVAHFVFSAPGTALLGWEGAEGIRIARYDLRK
jgi:hypothetical protein